MRGLAASSDVALALHQFRAFYAEVAECRQAVETGVCASMENSETDAPDEPISAARAVSARLRGVITGFGVDARRTDTQPPRIADMDSGYVMAAVADEIFLHVVKWPGQQAWLSTFLLEDALYGTRVAGQRIFEAIEELGRKNELIRLDVATVLLVALLLGFRGRYWGVDDGGKLQRMRAQLYELVFGRPYSSRVDWQEIMSNGHEPRLEESSVRRMPRLAPWLMALSGAVVVYLFLSHTIWRASIEDILIQADKVIDVHHESDINTGGR